MLSASLGSASETPHLAETPHLVFTCFQGHRKPLPLACFHLADIPLSLACFHLAVIARSVFTYFHGHRTPLLLACLDLDFSSPTMAEHFQCQHKGRALWDTHPSCVTCRIRQDILCSRDNPCTYCAAWSEGEWVFQDQHVDKIRRDWVFSLKQETPKPLSSLSILK